MRTNSDYFLIKNSCGQDIYIQKIIYHSAWQLVPPQLVIPLQEACPFESKPVMELPQLTAKIINIK